jgi:hypothetical protein
MIIRKVLSYKNAWETLTQQHQSELHEIIEALPAFIDAYIKSLEGDRLINRFTLTREVWEQELLKKGWDLIERTFYSESGRRIFLGNIGPIKIWLVQVSPLVKWTS